MDYYNFDSDIAENLVLLKTSPARVGRENNNLEYNCLVPDLGREPKCGWVKDFRSKVVCVPRHTRLLDGAFCPSLVLRKTGEKKIYPTNHSTSTLSHITHAQERPIIKVTVTPNSPLGYNPKIKKRRHPPKKIQSTVSNHEGSIKAKNVYLVLTSNKKEKIYELKAVGSGHLAEKHYQKDDPTATEVVGDFQQRRSPNMEKKRKKPKTNSSAPNNSKSSFADAYEGVEAKSAQSRVKITGEFGLNQDNVYVLRCNATVDDAPAGSNTTKLQSQNQATQNDKITKRTSRSTKRDTNIQTDYGFEMKESSNNPYTGIKMSIRTGNRNSSTQTQSMRNDFFLSNVEKLKIYPDTDHKLQCATNNVNITKIENCDNTDPTAPVVIISVYHKQDMPDTIKPIKNQTTKKTNQEIEPMKKLRSQNSPNKAFQSPYEVKNARSKDTKIAKPAGRSRSPDNKAPSSQSPENKSLKSRSPSPAASRSPTKVKSNKSVASNKPRITTVNRNDQNTFKMKPETNKNKLLNAKVDSPKNKSQRPRMSFQKTSHDKRSSTKIQKTGGRTSRTSDTATQGTNTEHILAKKALVDTYTRTITEHMKYRDGENGPKPNKSNLAININAPNELFNFMLQQNDLSTNLRIRQVKKDKEPHRRRMRSVQIENESESLENLLIMEPSDGAISQTVYDRTQDDNKYKSALSGIRLRDSLEITHRKEDLDSSTRPTSTDDSKQINNMYDTSTNEYPYPDESKLRHYRADKQIPDPIQRDSREVRQLPGVGNTGNKGKTKQPTKEDPVTESIDETSTSVCLQFDKLKWKRNETATNQHKMITKYVTEPKNYNFKTVDKIHNFENISKTDSEQVILRRNLNVFLQLKHLSKQKPIVLTRGQYEKVKRAIEKVGSQKSRTCVTKKCSLLYIGEVRRKPKVNKYNEKMQTQKTHKQVSKIVKDKGNLWPIMFTKETQVEAKLGTDRDDGTSTDCNPGDKSDNMKNVSDSSSTRKSYITYDEYENFSPFNSEKTRRSVRNNLWNEIAQGYFRCMQCGTLQNDKHNYCSFCGVHQTVCGDRTHDYNIIKTNGKEKGRRVVISDKQEKHAASSVEIRYTTMAYERHVTFSSTNIPRHLKQHYPPGICFERSKKIRRTDSILTIFKGNFNGRKKCATPNLGTSAYSLASECTNDGNPIQGCRQKPRRPLLKRLISCLVMRSGRPSAMKLDRPNPKILEPASLNSSDDSYHFSTSLGAIELSSSIYDTSASFYSDHSIHPLHGKLKRGLLKSVRGFLAMKR